MADSGMSASTLPAQRLFRAQHMGRGVGQPPMTAAQAEDSRPRDVGELCEQFVSVCESAVDSLEISSALEFEGWSDQAVRKHFGVPDVFELAEEMYLRVPRRPAEPDPLPEPWQASKVRPALHGLLYGLPTVCFPAAAGLLTGPGVLGVLIVVLLTSWALSQALAYLGYMRLGQADSVQAARLLQAGLAAGLAGIALVLAAAALVLPVRIPAIIFGAGLGAYMLGASVLTVLGAERMLLAVLAPGVLGAAAFLVLGRPPQLEHPAWAALAATPLLALALAVARTIRDAGLPSLGRGRHCRSEVTAGPLLAAAEFRGALPSAGFGLLAAGLLVFPVATGMPGHAGTNTGALLVSLPLALSMGAAEWTLIWFRRRTQRLLHTTWELRTFATRARLALLAALLQYLAAAVVLTAAVIAVAAETRLVEPHWTALPQIVAYMALGGAMFLALLLQAFGSRIVPLAGCAAALAFEIAYRGLGVPAQLVACTELLVVLAGYAALMLGSAMRHAC
jgi:uncharacterized membrane protein